MPAEGTSVNYRWLCSGDEVFPAMLAAIEAAAESVRLETYIFSSRTLGQRFREALLRAQRRGVKVQVLVDAVGSYEVPAVFWRPLREAGAEVRVFNPIALHRFGLRNHRKMLVCDRAVAFVGGFNIAPEYEGDGITSGWRDLGLELRGTLPEHLACAFDEMFGRAEFLHKRFLRLRKSGAKKTVFNPGEQLLLSGPGRGRNPIKQHLHRDLSQARSVQIMVAYFLPTWRIRRHLCRIAREGGRVQLILAGKSDVAVARFAGQSLYRRLLKAGVEVYEFQPQILHAKLVIIDDIVYVGSANLDQRSLNINYELMLRFEDGQMAAQAQQLFLTNLKYSRPVSFERWKSRSLLERLKQRWAYFLLVRVDPYIARRQWRALPD